MSVTIRLSRHGAKKHPFYRIVVADSRFPRDGRYIEQLGTYDPAPSPARVTVARETLEGWLARGAKPTETVAHVLKRAGFPARAQARPKAA
ncbi:MAG TPA: 30S ribosomal protein S16 [Candidatus Binatia bacterium]|nr:30S ribosomal protein S16 [Candidatus Binatia bacterium]